MGHRIITKFYTLLETRPPHLNNVATLPSKKTHL